MKISVYDSHKQALKNFSSKEEAIKYYRFMLDNNPESCEYPALLRELHEGIIIGLMHEVQK